MNISKAIRIMLITALIGASMPMQVLAMDAREAERLMEEALREATEGRPANPRPAAAPQPGQPQMNPQDMANIFLQFAPLMAHMAAQNAQQQPPRPAAAAQPGQPQPNADQRPVNPMFEEIGRGLATGFADPIIAHAMARALAQGFADPQIAGPLFAAIGGNLGGALTGEAVNGFFGALRNAFNVNGNGNGAGAEAWQNFWNTIGNPFRQGGEAGAAADMMINAFGNIFRPNGPVGPALGRMTAALEDLFRDGGNADRAFAAFANIFREGGAADGAFAAVPEMFDRLFRQGGINAQGIRIPAGAWRRAADGLTRLFMDNIDTLKEWGFRWTLRYGATTAAFATLTYANTWFWTQYMVKRPKLLLGSSSYWQNLKRKIYLEKTPMVFNKKAEKRLNDFLNTTKTIRAKIKDGNTLLTYENLLLPGPPGTGKTMFAEEKLIKETGMDYAKISGASLEPFIKNGTAITEINNLFAWANQSKNGLLIFIDEVDALLSSRKDTKENGLYQAISHLLALTGTPSNKFMLVMTTNMRENLDPAIIDRTNEIIEVPLPDFDQRNGVLRLYAKRMLFNPINGKTFVHNAIRTVTPGKVKEIAEKTEGLSNRSLQQIINTILAKGHTSKEGITAEIIDNAVKYAKEKVKNDGNQAATAAA
jgi:DNA polymerase III delta prime subunit/AcrR family transcriptional regulator